MNRLKIDHWEVLNTSQYMFYLCGILVTLCQHPSNSTSTEHNNMMTSSNGNIFRVTGPLCGEFPTQRPVTRSFDVFFDLRLNKRWSKQPRGWWFETLSRSLWRHRNAHCWIWLSGIVFMKFKLIIKQYSLLASKFINLLCIIRTSTIGSGDYA